MHALRTFSFARVAALSAIWILLCILIGPPFLLIAAWLVARWR
jgi:hypothetical protein